jgi:6-pyruvoyltetrahydropterin/6-carboxytetrahydropterin synthase
MHGHNWKLEVEVEAAALDDLGMAVDFKVVKEAARDLAASSITATLTRSSRSTR